MHRAMRVLVAAGLLAGALGTAAPAATATAATHQLQAGVGRADITPLTGVYKGGWVNSEARALGQHTRLYARAVVLQQGHTKLALVAEDLSFVGAGMIADAAALLRARGRAFSEQNIIDSATHTHGSQTGFMNFPAYNSVLPTAGNPTQFNVTSTDADPVMYSFMVRQLALAISRADDNLGPAAVGWGSSDLLGVTQNRSLEAHLANFGIFVPVGQGNVNQAPGGYPTTINPRVDVLRVDRVAGGRRVPLGMFSTFANHGTVVKIHFPYYTADHHGAAERVVEAAIRQAGRVPAGQDVVNAFANGDAGDVTAGIAHTGADGAEHVGRREADAMLAAWRGAGNSMTTNPALGYLWTRICFCGQQTSEGPADTTPVLGQSAGAGSEEGRTIFFDLGIAREGDMLPVGVGPQGNKVQVVPEKGSFPQAVPLAVARIGNRLIATVPGEPTVGAGRLLRDAVAGVVSKAGIDGVVLAGYAGDYLNYFNTPAEYDRQHYEGGSDVYGRTSVLVLRDGLVDLAQRFVSGQPPPDPYPFDPTNGVTPNSAPYGDGAASATASGQPSPTVARFGHATFAWHGSANGLDRPVDHEFVTVSRLTPPPACNRLPSVRVRLRSARSGRVRRVSVFVDGRLIAILRGNRRTARVDLRSAKGATARVRIVVTTDSGRYTLRRTVRICPPTAGSAWRPFQTDLGLQIAWLADASGNYRALWEVPLDAPAGLYRLNITAKRYALTSNQFRVHPNTSLALERAPASPGGVGVRLAYPVAGADGLTYRPPYASGGTVAFTVGSRRMVVTQQTGTDFSVEAPSGARVAIAAGAAKDRFGNANGQAVTLQP